MADALAIWALPKLSNLLPLDPDSLQQIISYTITLPKPAAAEHLKNLLGDSPQALEFIATFNSRRGGTLTGSGNASRPQSPAPGPDRGNDDIPARRTQKKKRPKAPLHSAGPARRPEGYGDVSGGYTKASLDEGYIRGGSRSNPSSRPTSVSSGLQLSSQPEALQLPQPASSNPSTPSSLPSSRIPSRTASPNPAQAAKQKLPPSAAGHLISENLLPNVRSRTLKSHFQQTSRSNPTSASASPSRKPHSSNSSTSKTTTPEITDLTSAISLLERTTNPTTSSKQPKVTCPCNATLHPLFTPAPNCLHCGKIICTLEGSTLQPCSFCGTPLLTPTQVQEMIRTLKEERGVELMAAHYASAHPTQTGPGPSPGSTADQALGRAQDHKNKLLAFQRENARRTRVVDEVAEFDQPEVSAWMSPVERAKALKSQQRYAREMEEKNKPEWERKRTVLTLDVSGGKVRRTYERVERSGTGEAAESQDASAEEDEHPDAIEPGGSGGTVGYAEEGRHRGGAFSHNPLLSSAGAGVGKAALVRPIWKPREQEPSDTDAKRKDKGAAGSSSAGMVGEAGSSSRESTRRKDTWRRVQGDDDNEGEKWILDEGAYGYRYGDGTEARVEQGKAQHVELDTSSSRGDEPECG